MFDEIGKTPDVPTPRWLALVFLGFYMLIGITGVSAGLLRYGITRPFHLLIYGTVLILSMIWLVLAWRSETIETRKFNPRMILLICLMFGSRWIPKSW